MTHIKSTPEAGVMTREELERAVERAVAFMSPAEVRVVIDLVVEACCAELAPMSCVCAQQLRQSFLPTPTKENDRG